MLLVAMKVLNLDVSSTDTANTRTVLVQCKYGIVLDTKGLLFSSIYVNIVLFSTQRTFVFKYLCKYCIVLNTKVFCLQASV